MTHNRILLSFVVCAVLLLVAVLAVSAQGETLTPNEELGKLIFFDENLSVNQNQSCASCHDPAVGWTGPHSDVNAHGSVYEGSIPGAFGDRKPPSSAYATQSPNLWRDRKGTWMGGNFWDGRATGQILGNPAADQAQGPFLNPKEQALPNAEEVVALVCTSDYNDLFLQVWGPDACDDTDTAYDYIALSIAAYEASPEVNAFSSKLDLSLKGQAKLSKLERQGWALFNGKGQCSRCHPGNGHEALFTDYTFDNLGVPKNPENPVYDENPGFIDEGLGGFLEDYSPDFAAENLGKQKVPTLRNVDLRPDDPDFVKAYSHNGYFKSLEGIVHFYNTRDVLDVCPDDHDYTEAEALAANCWPAPEVAENVNTAELGDLGLSPAEEAAIVAFLRTLSDGYTP